MTGPILEAGLPKIGPNGVSVPKYYYKVILDNTEPGIKAIGFVLPNIGSRNELRSFAVSVDRVEAVTGLDFFPGLQDNVEFQIEGDFDFSDWKGGKTNQHRSYSKEFVNSGPRQCQGITKKGLRCKRRTKAGSGFCYQHD